MSSNDFEDEAEVDLEEETSKVDVWDNGYPWYMDEEDIERQAELLRDPLDKGLDTASFTPDAPVLYKQAEHYLLVYGTLKRNKMNHRLLNNEATAVFVADCFTANDHFVMRETKGGIPVVFSTFQEETKGALGKQIKCELYLVRTKLLKALDIFEQNGVVYRRVKIAAAIPQEDKDIIVPAWTYIGLPRAFTGIVSGMKTSPSFTRRRKSGDKEFYTYIGAKEF